VDADTFAVTDGVLVTDFGFLGYHGGWVPSIWVRLLWRWDGQEFTTTMPFGPRCEPLVDSVAVGGLCLEVPEGWLSIRDASTWLGADWVDVIPSFECDPAQPCVGFQVYTGVSFDRVLAGNESEVPFDADNDAGWWTQPGTPTTCHAEAAHPVTAPNLVTSSTLAVSDVQPLAGQPADHRQWTIGCTRDGPQQVQAWILPAQRLLVVSGPLPADLQAKVSAVVAGAALS
jgi:hypothetical protein